MPRFALNQAAVQRMFESGGQVWVAVNGSADTVLLRARAGAPRRTGALARSLRKLTVVRPLGLDVYIGSDLPYAGYVHEGTGPHLIAPRQAQVLAFTIGGRRVYAKHVNHPGTKADPFLRRALQTEFPGAV